MSICCTNYVILIESSQICAHLQPKDILNLSRASKNLRKFFMSRNSAPIWKTALSNVSILPTCPGDLSEPAYVDLMFGSHCYVSRRNQITIAAAHKHFPSLARKRTARTFIGCPACVSAKNVARSSELQLSLCCFRALHSVLCSEVYEPLDKRAKGMIQPYELTELVPPIRYLDKREGESDYGCVGFITGD